MTPSQRRRVRDHITKQRKHKHMFSAVYDFFKSILAAFKSARANSAAKDAAATKPMLDHADAAADDVAAEIAKASGK